MMNSQLEDLLESTALEPPEGFAVQVMGRVKRLPPAPRARNAPRWMPWIALVCGFVLGIDELVGFILSAWMTVTAN
jgi:hypothetical protein